MGRLWIFGKFCEVTIYRWKRDWRATRGVTGVVVPGCGSTLPVVLPVVGGAAGDVATMRRLGRCWCYRVTAYQAGENPIRIRSVSIAETRPTTVCIV